MKNTFKKGISLFLLFTLLLSIVPASTIVFVNAADDTVEWSLVGVALTVSGSGELSEEFTSTEEWQKLKSSCLNVRIESGITAIGSNAFKGFSLLKKVEILGDITKIGEYAFAECTALTEINLPDSVTVIDSYAFANCSSIESIDIPENLVKINAWAFKNCTCFDGKHLVLPDTLQKLSLGSFYGADIIGLTAPFVGVGPIDWEDSGGNATYHIGYMFGDQKFDNSYLSYDSSNRKHYYLPNSLTEVTITKYIYDHNFESAKEIEKIHLKDTVDAKVYPTAFAKNCTGLVDFVAENTENITFIGTEAFRSCYFLENFDIPKNVTEISSLAFANCTFNTIELPDKLEKIGLRAFQNNPNITEIVIPESVHTIADYAFVACTNLEKVTLPDPPPAIGESAFAETKYTGGTDTGDNVQPGFSVSADGVLRRYSGSEEIVVVPDYVKEISARAFDECKSIKELVIPESVTVINAEAFAGMCNLRKLTVPFVGKSRDVLTDSREALIGYWFSKTDDHDCIYNCYGSLTEIKQVYNDTNYFMRSYKPRYFTELTVTDSILRSNALQNYGLTVLNLGANIKGIEKYAANKIGLEVINFDENVKITEIPDYAFCNNKITSITIPGSVKRIGKAFICDYYPDNQLAEINLNEGLEVIEGSFAGSKITSIEFPSTLKRILKYSFRNCVKLEYVEFPENMIEIGDWAFEVCFGLKEVVFSDTISKIGSCAFLDCPVQKIVIPEAMESIVEQTFYECEDLQIVVIGSNISEIGAEAFAGCPSLEMVVIPDNVTSISDTAFSEAGENLVIYCNEGSYAQQYAEKNNIRYTTLVLDSIPNQTYTGKAIEPTVRAKVNNVPLTLNAEYTLKYSNNIDVGVAKITARGLGDFRNLVATGKFNIVQCGIGELRMIFDSTLVYSAGGNKPDIKLYNNGCLLTEGEDYELVGVNKINGVGVYNIAVKGKGNFNGVQNLTVEVTPRSIKKVSVSSTDPIKLTDSGYTLVKGVDYNVESRADENGDTSTYVVGKGNYSGEKLVKSNGGSGNVIGGENIFSTLFNMIRNLFNIILKLFS